nr:unnamed protein product [Spirometra erinaceieuropaei]
MVTRQHSELGNGMVKDPASLSPDWDVNDGNGRFTAQALSYEYGRGYGEEDHYLSERYELPYVQKSYQRLPSQQEFSVIPERREKRPYQRMQPKKPQQRGVYLYGLRGKNFKQREYL